MNTKFKSFSLMLLGALIAALFGACAMTNSNNTASTSVVGKAKMVVISVRDQKLTVVREGGLKRLSYPISTSKFGVGDKFHSWETPIGKMEIASKIGAGAPIGSVFHSRVRTGEVIKVNAPGRDAIVTRILALRGLEAGNARALDRGIYIHGTPEERNIGVPSSYGCIRMRSKDVVELYDMVYVGTKVYVLDSKQGQAVASSGSLLTQSSPSLVAAVSNKHMTTGSKTTLNASTLERLHTTRRHHTHRHSASFNLIPVNNRIGSNDSIDSTLEVKTSSQNIRNL